MRHPFAASRRSLQSPFVLACSLAALLSAPAVLRAADFTWDPLKNTTGSDGAGTWNTTAGNNVWASGGVDSVWVSSAANNAIFGVNQAAAGVVTLNTNLTVGNITFNPAQSGNYTITPSGTVALTMGTGNIIANGSTDTAINVNLAGTLGLTKTGTGTITLSNLARSFTGAVNINGGVLAVNTGTASADQTVLGAGAKAINVNNGGTFRIVSGNFNPTSGTKSVVIGTGTLDVLANQTLTLDDAGQFASTGTAALTKTGDGLLVLGAATNAYTFSGTTAINGGTVRIANIGALGGAANTLTLGGTGTLVVAQTASAGTLLNPMTLTSGTFALQSQNTTLGGALTISGTGAGSTINARDNAATTPTARTISVTGALGGAGVVTVNGPTGGTTRGIVSFNNAASTFTGTINVGSLVSIENKPTVNGTTATNAGRTFGTASFVINGAGSQLDIRDTGSGSSQTLVYNNNLTLNNSLNLLISTGAVGTNTGNTVQLGSLSNNGAQTLTVAASNGYLLDFANGGAFGGALTLNSNTPVSMGGTFTETVAGSTFTQQGTGTLTLRGTANYSGATTLTAGVLLNGAAGRLPNTTAITLPAGAALTIDNSLVNVANRVNDAAAINMTAGTLTLNSLIASATAGAETVGAVTLSGANTINVNQGNASAMATLTFASLTRNTGATVTFNGTNLGQPGITPRVVITNQAASTFLGPNYFAGSDFAQYVTTLDNGVARGITSVDSILDPADETGVTAGANVKLDNAGYFQLSNNATINSLAFSNTRAGAAVDVGSSKLVLQSGGLLVGNGYSVVTGFGGSFTVGSTNTAVRLVATVQAGGTLSVDANITNNAAGGVLSIIKSGPGTLELLGSNTFSGDVIVREGVLSVSSVGDVGTPNALGFGSNPIQLGSDLSSGVLNFILGQSSSTNRPFAFSGVGGTINVDQANASLTLLGAITGTNLTKTGAGTLILGTPQNFGGISGNGGVIQLNSTHTLASITANSGTARIGETGVVTVTGNLTAGTDTGLVDPPLVGTIDTVAGASLTVGNGATSSINVGYRPVATTTGRTNGLIDLSKLNNLTANLGFIRVGIDSGANSGLINGTLILAKNNNITAATSVVVGDSPADGTTGTHLITFGSGTNTLATPLMTIGGRKYGGNLNIGAGGSLTVGSATARTTLNVGVNSVDTGTAPTSLFDMTGGSLIGNFGAVDVGEKAGGGAGRSTGTLDFGTSASTNVSIDVATGNALRIGTYTFTGGTQPLAGSATGTTNFRNGVMTINNSATDVAAVTVGAFANTAGSITGAAANNSATGTFSVSGGAVTITSTGVGAAIALAPQTLQAATVGVNSATGTLNVSGGTLSVNNAILGSRDRTNTSSTINLTGGTLDMGGKNITLVNTVNFNGGTLRNLGVIDQGLTQTGNSSLFDLQANDATITGAYALTDGDLKVMAGRTLNVTGGANFSGSAGAIMNGTLTGSLATVNTGATVSGTGNFAGGLRLNGGIVSPGVDNGSMNVGTALTLNGGTLHMELFGHNTGGFDQINVTGGVSLTANTNIELAISFTPAVNDTFMLIVNDLADLIGSPNGSLFGFNGGSPLAEGGSFTTSQGFQFGVSYVGGDGNDLVLTTLVPEPSAALSLLTGSSLLLGLGRFRRRSLVRA